MRTGPWIFDADSGRWWVFPPAQAVLCALRPSEVRPLLCEVERAVDAGRWAVGLVSYEAAPGFDPAMRTQPPRPDLPLAWFYIGGPPTQTPRPPFRPLPLPPLRWSPLGGEAAYRQTVEEIRRRIAAGAVYQVNLTTRWRAPIVAPPAALLRHLWRAQPRSAATLIEAGEWAVASASPELFFQLDGNRIVSRPMKGTAPRGPDPDLDRAAAEALAGSGKERAENIMIVDMVRNDLGRIARPGSVRVERRFEIEGHPTVWQMTSTVAAETQAGLAEVFAALFPAASITGAPKIEAMRTIADLEPAPRGVYTGAIGFVAPGRRARFQVAIRTAVVHGRNRTAEYGAGGGIVWDSDPAREWAEALAKTRILVYRPPRFRLLETLRWDVGRGFRRPADHLRRMAGSAQLFGFRYDAGAALRALRDAARRWRTGPRKVRILVDRQGRCEVQSALLPAARRPWRLALAPWPVDPDSPFLRNKTTCRSIYDRARRSCPAADDVLLWNTRGELTESTVANLVLQFGRDRLTPPVASGLLPGTFRARLLAAGRIREAVLRRDDLDRADRIWLINSVRGWIPAQRVCPPGGGRSRPPCALPRPAETPSRDARRRPPRRRRCARRVCG